MKKNRFFLFSFIFLLLFLFVTYSSANSPVKEENFIGANAPQFKVTNLNGTTLSLDKLLDTYKVIVLNFWGLRCGACIEEMPHLSEIYKKYRENVIILGVNVDAVDGDFLKGQIDKMGLVMDYEVVPDPEFTMVDIYQMTAAPLTIVIDSAGVIQYRHENYEPGDEKNLEEVIKSLLDGKKVVVK